ncbi:MAG: GWxTD domain-containing protein, partial [Candidatus Aminicenantes bacterium]|nr:GWxTD domain-containing protein [Candidatus Aminicenantes bacterium]
MICIWGLAFLCASACRGTVRMKDDPFFDSIYEKAQIIMTKEERTVYRNLPDRESKAAFIDDFWAMRDPDPGTEENENKIAFEERIEYANTWFGLYNTHRGRPTGERGGESRGWDTDRGNIYILLGPPDELYFDNGEPMPTGRLRSRPQARQSETWAYRTLRVYVQFILFSGDRWILSQPSPEFTDVMEAAKLNLIDPELRMDAENRLIFNADFSGSAVDISIPLSRLRFKESEKRLFTVIRIQITVYLDQQKITVLNHEETVSGTEEELLGKKNVSIPVPFRPDQKGKYRFDILVEDTMAFVYSRYRRTVHYTQR